MSEQYRSKPYPLSKLNDARQLVRVRCAYCKRQHHYYPTDLIQLFGDVDVDSLAGRMTCENAQNGSHGLLDVAAIFPTAYEAVGLKIGRLASIKFKRVPVWRED